MLNLKYTFLVLMMLSGELLLAQTDNVRGLRVDPSYFYTTSSLAPEAIAQSLVARAKASGVNTLFVYAYNSHYGAYYPTEYELVHIENGYGKINIFKIINTEAKKNGDDYLPLNNNYLLSAWHPDFRNWLKSFYTNFLTLNPDVDGIEAVEPVIDFKWAKESDYNPVANKKFSSLYPKAQLGDADWLAFRAQGLTDLIATLNATCAEFKKESYLVQTWPVQKDGSLHTADTIRDNTGLDFNAI